MLRDLARKFIGTKAWRWLPGMLTLGGNRIKHVADNGDVYLDRGYVNWDASGNWIVDYPMLDKDDLPNVQDHATMGAMMEVLRCATGCNVSLFFKSSGGRWVLEINSPGDDVSLKHTNSWGAMTAEEAFLMAFESLDEDKRMENDDECI